MKLWITSDWDSSPNTAIVWFSEPTHIQGSGWHSRMIGLFMSRKNAAKIIANHDCELPKHGSLDSLCIDLDITTIWKERMR